MKLLCPNRRGPRQVMSGHKHHGRWFVLSCWDHPTCWQEPHKVMPGWLAVMGKEKG